MNYADSNVFLVSGLGTGETDHLVLVFAFCSYLLFFSKILKGSSEQDIITSGDSEWSLPVFQHAYGIASLCSQAVVIWLLQAREGPRSEC